MRERVFLVVENVFLKPWLCTFECVSDFQKQKLDRKNSEIFEMEIEWLLFLINFVQ